MAPAVREATVSVIDVVWYALAFVVTTLALFGSISPWLTLPLLLWFIAYAGLLRVFIPKARDRSREGFADNQFFIQYQMSLGAHGAHRY